MPSEITIESPTTLATLPQPLDPTNGQTLATNVLGVKHGPSPIKRRKRTEVAVGIDGVGISLYDVQTPRLITSYSLPPQATFTCPPCSVHLGNGSRSSKQRLSYASIISPKPQIAHFRQGSARTSLLTATYNVPSAASPIRYLDVLPRHPSHPESVLSIDVLAVHEDGQIRCLKGDLTKELWATQVSAIVSAGDSGAETRDEIYVEHITMTDAATAKEGLLKDREDLQAFLAPFPQEGAEQVRRESSVGKDDLQLRSLPVLVIIGRPSGPESDHEGRMVYVFCIRDRSQSNPSGQSSTSLHLLGSKKLPKVAHLSARTLLAPQYSLDPVRGALSVLLADEIITYDLSSTIPKLSSQLYVGRTKFDSFVRLTASSILTTSSYGIGVYDTKFQSLQASLAYNGASFIDSDTKKRKIEYVIRPPNSPIKIIAYFKNLDLVVGLADGVLVGVQVSSSSTHGAQIRKRRKGGLLIDAIGRGLEPPATEASSLPSNEVLPRKIISGYVPGSLSRGNKTLAGLKDELDNYARLRDVESFERIIANLLRIERNETPLREWNKRRNAWERDVATKAINGTDIANGFQTDPIGGASTPNSADDEVDFAEEKPLPTWKINGADSTAEDFSHLHDEIIRYVVSKMFQWNTGHNSGSALNPEGNNEPSLHLVFYTPNIFKWLVDSQGFHFNLLRRMLLRQQGTTPSTQVMARALINAFADFDPELRILHSLLLGPIFFGPVQLTEVIRHVLQSLEYVGRRSRSPKPQTNGGEDTHMNGDLDAALSQEEDAAEIDIGFALDTLEFGSAIREQTLTLALLRLNAKPAVEVTKAFRSQLTLEEITVLIQILRKELATGGWTSRYLDGDPLDPQADSEATHEDRNVRLIITLLNCAVDAINVPGWTLNNVDENEDLIAMLKFEVSAALEGIEEATYLQGLLQEILRYQRRLEEATPKPAKNGRGEKGQGNSKPITLPMAGQNEKRILPLGLKVECEVSRTKIGAGGEVSRRSARDVGMLKSRMVGLYSRERIVL